MCPYCNSNKISDPHPLVTDGVEELVALGIPVPITCMCLDCAATLSEHHFNNMEVSDARVSVSHHA